MDNHAPLHVKIFGILGVVGFCVIATFQGFIAIGAPVGEWCYGGAYAESKTIPPKLRLVSLIFCFIWFYAAMIIKHRSGWRTSIIANNHDNQRGSPTLFWNFCCCSCSCCWSHQTIIIGTRVLIFLMGLSTLANWATPAPKERALWGPVCTITFVSCIVVSCYPLPSNSDDFDPILDVESEK